MVASAAAERCRARGQGGASRTARGQMHVLHAAGGPFRFGRKSPACSSPPVSEPARLRAQTPRASGQRPGSLASTRSSC